MEHWLRLLFSDSPHCSKATTMSQLSRDGIPVARLISKDASSSYALLFQHRCRQNETWCHRTRIVCHLGCVMHDGSCTAPQSARTRDNTDAVHTLT